MIGRRASGDSIMVAASDGDSSGIHNRRHSAGSYPIAEVFQRARKRVESLNEPGHSEELQFSASRKVQYLSGIAANMGALALGVVLSWSAVALPDLRKDPEIGPNMTDAAESWIGSIVTLAAVVSTPIAGIMLERIGRRRSMLLFSVPFLAGWLLIYFANSVNMINAGRFMTGFCGGGFVVIAPLFIAEVADVKIRGLMGAGFDLCITIGQLTIFVLGSFMSWRVYTLFSAFIPAVIFVMMLFVPESPLYLVEKGDEAGAMLSLMRLHGATTSKQVENELASLRQSNQRSKEESARWKDMFSAAILKPISISLILFILQVISGIDPVLFYTVDIFQAAGSTIDEYYSAIYVGIVQVVAALGAAFLVDHFGRKIFLILSEIFMVISLCTLSLYFYLKYNSVEQPYEGLSWLPLTSLIVFVFAYSMGLGPIAYLLLGELVPPQVKGLAACILTCVKWSISFCLVKFYGNMTMAMGIDGTFLLFAAFCLIGLFYILFFVPETKGKTLAEIQEGFADSEPEGEKQPLIPSVVSGGNSSRPYISA